MDIFHIFIFNRLHVVRIVTSVEMMHGVLSVTAVLCAAFIVSFLSDFSHCTDYASVFCPSVVEQCICNRIQADEMVLEWVAFSTNKNGLKLNLDNLDQFEHEVAICFCFL